MKKWKMALALCLAALALCACKRSDLAGNLGATLGQWQEGRSPAAAPAEPRVSEILPAADGSFAGALGFSVSSLPEADGLAPVRFFAIDGWVGQVEYERKLEHGTYLLVLRAARAGEKSLADTYPESHSQSRETLSADGTNADVYTDRDGCVLVCWTRGDFQYTLHSNKLQGMPAAADIELLVAGLNSEDLG